MRRGRSSDNAEAYRNFCGIAAHCKNAGSLLHSTGQHNVRRWRAVAPDKALPDQPAPVKARASRARRAGSTALTGAGRPSVYGHALMAQRERYAAPHRNDSADKLAPFSRWSLPAAGAPWLIIKNLGRDERGHWVRCPTTSTTICGHQFDEGAAQQRRNNLSGP